MYGSTGSIGGVPQWGTPSPGARIAGQSIAPMRSSEGKVAKMFVDKTNLMVFNSTIFAEVVCALGGEPMQPRTMEIVKALIRNLAFEYDSGVYNDATVMAKRLNDTLDLYRM